MKIVVAPDSFKESLDAARVMDSIERGFKKVFPGAETVKIPMADGGEGTVHALVKATGGKLIEKRVSGPLGEPVDAAFGILGGGKTAVIEMAAASGLHLVPMEKRNPLLTTTRGTGELILAALDERVEHIIIGLGGSSTVEGGMGMAKALGVRFLNEKGEDISEGGRSLADLEKIDTAYLDPRLQHVFVEAACDVDNPLIGERGAAEVFGPQKGADPEMVRKLDENLTRFAEIVRRDMNKEIAFLPGAGAAGGLGAGLVAFLNARLKPGIDIVLSAIGFAEKLKGADLVITGEGKIDGQTIFGKTPIGVAKAAKKRGIPVIAIAGTLGDGYESVYEHGIDALFSSTPGIISLKEALQNADENIERTAYNIARFYKIAKL